MLRLVKECTGNNNDNNNNIIIIIIIYYYYYLGSWPQNARTFDQFFYIYFITLQRVQIQRSLIIDEGGNPGEPEENSSVSLKSTKSGQAIFSSKSIHDILLLFIVKMHPSQ